MEPVRRQRAILCDLLEGLTDQQWAAETLCDGWDAGDMAAHLLVREREPWAAGGIVLKPLAGFTESRMAARKAKGRDEMLRQLRIGPPIPFRMGPLAKAQVSEDYIHAEDVRRGGATAFEGPVDLTPDDGTGDPVTDDLLWEAVGRFAVMTFGGVRASGVLAMTDGGRTRAHKLGGRMARSAPGGAADVTVSGPAGELLLYTTGRRAARVDVAGEGPLMDALQASGRSV